MDKEKESDSIEHKGIVQEVSPGVVKVNLFNVAVCSSCHAKGACSVSEVDNKIIEILSADNTIKKGDHVTVAFEKSLGPKALLLGYLLPFIVVFIVLFVCWEISGNEAISGIIALVSLVPYYLALFLFRHRLSKEFAFNIKDIQHSV